MTEPLEPVGPPMACNRCGMRLNSHEQWKDGKLMKLSWEHTMLRPEGWKDHAPEPILLDLNESPLVGFCDFCSTQDPTWAFPTAPFKIGAVENLGYGSADNWAACQECKEDIEANNWDAVHQRFFSHKAVPKFARSILRKDVEGLHRQFRLNRLGPPFRVR